ncbi:hypothetical protein JAAARDRAFT_208142 [Jaapia argillacea MUCL 33604]|uniref:Uncharacterized protein n=1 Tax=Jaapia argillacea MUCL 33604 TaxID=933084 RepID=A0A067Q1K8_9AGAM|nr:hypothetical protein JAAARDRAFT_208142 [Jaapia argillacea MUCL 33604]
MSHQPPTPSDNETGTYQITLNPSPQSVLERARRTLEALRSRTPHLFNGPVQGQQGPFPGRAIPSTTPSQREDENGKVLKKDSRAYHNPLCEGLPRSQLEQISRAKFLTLDGPMSFENNNLSPPACLLAQARNNARVDNSVIQYSTPLWLSESDWTQSTEVLEGCTEEKDDHDARWKLTADPWQVISTWGELSRLRGCERDEWIDFIS